MAARPLLVVGFLPFGGVVDNPAARVARAVDGRVAGPWRVRGEAIPVSYSRGPRETLRLAGLIRPAAILGVGVAVARPGAALERWARAGSTAPGADVDGQRLSVEDQAPRPLFDGGLAAALGVGFSDDAGGYVCNGWAWAVSGAAGVPVGFLHVPERGFCPACLLSGLAAWVLPGEG